jgi:hypothetical protein
MPMIVWGLDEIAESIVLIYGAIVGLLALLVVLEQRLDHPAPLTTRHLRILSRRYLNRNVNYPPELRDWLRSTASWEVHALASQLHLSREQSGQILQGGGYHPDGTDVWRSNDAPPQRSGPGGPG